MNCKLVVRNQGTQDLRQQANYILLNRNTDIAVKFLLAAEMTFAQLAKTPSIGKVTQLVVFKLGEIRQWRIKDFKDYLIFIGFRMLLLRFFVYFMEQEIW